jgi:hypothetical protein
MRVQPQSIKRFSGQTSVSAWRALLAQVAPDLSPTRLAQQPQVWPRFAAYYAHLHQLPRRVRRGLQRRLRRGRRAQRSLGQGMLPKGMQSIAGLALMLALGQVSAFAATLNVGGGCTLVDAITAANTDNAIGLCPAGSGADRIVLPANSTQTLTAVNNLVEGPNGLPVVTSTITVAGNGSTIARSAAAGTPDFRILQGAMGLVFGLGLGALGNQGNETVR